jgi:hypothetical protein
MSYNITLYCGCVVYVACHPHTGVAHTRVLERRHPRCPVRKHEIGLRLATWELLPEPHTQATEQFVAEKQRPAHGAWRAALGTRRKAF